MGKKILFYSTDKMYKVNNKFFSIKAIMNLCLVFTCLLGFAAVFGFLKSTTINAKNSDIKYNEIGKVDYKVYLKENSYYDSSYLKSGMQYVASLINTINVQFNYEIHSTKDISFDNRYQVIGKLEITERDDPTKVLYNKDEVLIKENNIKLNGNNFVINENVDIDYAKYNSIVNAFKKDLGLVVSSNLILTLKTNTNGKYNDDVLNKTNELKIIIPLSEATLNISMDSNEINNEGSLGESNKLFRVDNLVLFIITVFLMFLLFVMIIIDINIYIKYFKKDIYRYKIKKILNEYDRLIVAGTYSIDESKYPNKFYPNDFKEMVDVAQNFNVPILFYEVIPNEKCFFVVVHDEILYKYRLTRAFLENDNNIKTDDIISSFDNEKQVVDNELTNTQNNVIIDNKPLEIDKLDSNNERI